MAPAAGERGRLLQMPKGPVQRSILGQQQKRQALANTYTAVDYEPRRSSRIALITKPEYFRCKRKAGREGQRLDGLEGRSKLKGPRISKPSHHNQAQKRDIVKQSKIRTRPSSIQAKRVPNSSQTRKRVPRGSQQLPAKEATERAPPSRLTRSALRQLESETAKDPLPEEIRKVMLFLNLGLLC